MVRILRITRHPATEDQVADLERIHGPDLDIVEVAEQVDADRVKQLAEGLKADVVVATLPIAMVAQLTGRNGLEVPLVRAVMRREEKGGQSTVFHFVKHVLMKKVEIVEEDL